MVNMTAQGSATQLKREGVMTTEPGGGVGVSKGVGLGVGVELLCGVGLGVGDDVGEGVGVAPDSPLVMVWL